MASAPMGVLHRARCDVTVWRYTFDALELSRTVLRRGAVFQPWDASDDRVRISLGDTATAQPEWSHAQPHALFLRHRDFIDCCQLDAEADTKRPITSRDVPPYPSPFDELPAIIARLKSPSATALEELHACARDYANGADFERAASSFDNTAAMREGAEKMERALVHARALLHTLRERST